MWLTVSRRQDLTHVLITVQRRVNDTDTDSGMAIIENEVTTSPQTLQKVELTSHREQGAE